MNSTIRTTILFAVAATVAPASTIHFVGVPTGVNDGVDYVTPYQVTIDGTPQLVTCYDIFDNLNFGDTWQANVLTLNQAAASGYFAGSLAGYKRVAWLDVQTYSNAAQQVGLQHAIWDVFGSAPATPETSMYLAAADAAAANAYAGFDFSRFRFIEQIGGVVGRAGTEQALVYAVQPSTPSVPEPGTLAMLLGGTLVWAIVYYNRHKLAGPPPPAS